MKPTSHFFFPTHNGTHQFQIAAYHIRPQYQAEQLTATGWSLDTVYDPVGRIVDLDQPVPDVRLYNLCRPVFAAKELEPDETSSSMKRCREAWPDSP